VALGRHGRRGVGHDRCRRPFEAAEFREHQYHAAREQQGFIEGRISEIESRLSNTEVIDVMTLQFKLPALINPPAKIKKQAIIQEIITNLRIDAEHQDGDVEWQPNDFLLQEVTTPGDYSIALIYINATTYNISLTNHAGNPTDTLGLSTIVYSQSDPQLIPGTNLTWNGVLIPVNTNVLADFVASTNELLLDTNMSLKQINGDLLHFVNAAGTDNVFMAGIPDALGGLGITAGIHPGKKLSWRRLLEAYGNVKPASSYGLGASSIDLLFGTDVENISQTVSGFIDWHPLDENLLVWLPISSTLPSATIPAITAVVNPQVKGPLAGLPASALGQRYLLLEKPADESASWLFTGRDTVTVSLENPLLTPSSNFVWNGHLIPINGTDLGKFASDTTALLSNTGLYVTDVGNILRFINDRGTANSFARGSPRDGLLGIGIEPGTYGSDSAYAQANDIVEWDGNLWKVSWSASMNQNTAYVTNQLTGKLLEWDGQQWSEYLPKKVFPGYWHINI
jgi:hypothetical protein